MRPRSHIDTTYMQRIIVRVTVRHATDNNLPWSDLYPNNVTGIRFLWQNVTVKYSSYVFCFTSRCDPSLWFTLTLLYLSTYLYLNNAVWGERLIYSLTQTINNFSISVHIISKKKDKLSNVCFLFNFDTYNKLWLNLNRIFIIINDFSKMLNGFKIINANY